MSSGRRRWSLGSLLLLLGRSLAVLVEIHRDSVNGTVGQPVLLPVSYRFEGAPHFPVSIVWTPPNSSDPLITCTVFNCSLGAWGAPSDCSAKHFLHPTYHNRAKLFPENGSLLLWDLRLGDSGVYGITFRPSSQTWHFTLTVHNPRLALEHPANTVAQNRIHHWAIGICCSVALLLLLLLLGCARRRARQRRRSTEQRQVPDAEASRAGSAAVRGADVETIYSRVGDRFGEPRPRMVAEVVYTSMASPNPPRLTAGPYQLLV
ncbi:uncharacterized protein VSU04_008899 isoform 1-T1 [Chlamydotis macqueenii]